MRRSPWLTVPARGPRLATSTGYVSKTASSGFRTLQLSPRSFIKMTLGAPTGVDVDQLKAENEQLRKKCDELTLKLEDVQAKLAEAEGGGEA